ncbi:hypothetical protein WA158_000608 [Blastocystis sp. Blastoise]
MENNVFDKPWMHKSDDLEDEEDEEYPKPSEPVYDQPKYRRPKEGKAIKVYSVALESRYLIIRNISQIQVIPDLINMLKQFGTIEEYRHLVDVKAEPFTETIWVKFEQLIAARMVKNKLNKKSFFGRDLFIYYDIYSETPSDTKNKLNQRLGVVRKRVHEKLDIIQHKPISNEFWSSALPEDEFLSFTNDNTNIDKNISEKENNNHNINESFNQNTESTNDSAVDSFNNYQPLIKTPKYSYPQNKIYPQKKPNISSSISNIVSSPLSNIPSSISSSTISNIPSNLSNIPSSISSSTISNIPPSIPSSSPTPTPSAPFSTSTSLLKTENSIDNNSNSTINNIDHTSLIRNKLTSLDQKEKELYQQIKQTIQQNSNTIKPKRRRRI